MTDAHLHIGKFYKMYITAQQLLEFTDSVGIDKIAVSSTSICEECYEKVIDEMKSLVSLGGVKVFPILWLTPLMIAKDTQWMFVDSGIKWRCIKVHPEIHPYWTDKPENMDDAAELATLLKVPILVHTAERPNCYAKLLEPTIKNHPSINFILAHSQPVNQVIELLEEYENVYADTAFCPLEEIYEMVEAGYSDRILWGSDYLIPLHQYQYINLQKSYLSKLKTLKLLVNDVVFEKITLSNFDKLFFSDLTRK